MPSKRPDLLCYLGAALRELPRPRGYLLALSGGLDSITLLHAVHRLRGELGVPLRAVHVDHGLHPDSDRWSAFCRRQCRARSVPMVERRVRLSPQAGESLEALARQARWSVMGQVLQPEEMLLLAHHADDQAETVLLQLMRGAGVAGLAAMATLRRWRWGWVARPLLGLTRSQLQAWAQAQGLEWLEDPSNRELRFDRNHLRHCILPQLAERRPGLATALGRAAAHCAEAAGLLEELAESDRQRAVPRNPWQLDLFVLQSLSPARQRNLLRYWIRYQGLTPPGQARMESLRRQMTTARPHRTPRVAWPGGEVRRHRGRLHLLPQAPVVPPAGVRLSWNGRKPLVLPAGAGRLVPTDVGPHGLPEALEVTFRSPGLQCRPAGSAHRRPFKTLCQELGLPPWVRPLVPLVTAHGRLVAVADLVTCHPFEGEPPWRWERPLWLE